MVKTGVGVGVGDGVRVGVGVGDGVVHMLLSIPPKYSVSSVIGFMKGKSAIHIARVYGGRRRNYRLSKTILAREGVFLISGLSFWPEPSL